MNIHTIIHAVCDAYPNLDTNTDVLVGCPQSFISKGEDGEYTIEHIMKWQNNRLNSQVTDDSANAPELELENNLEAVYFARTNINLCKNTYNKALRRLEAYAKRTTTKELHSKQEHIIRKVALLRLNTGERSTSILAVKFLELVIAARSNS